MSTHMEPPYFPYSREKWKSVLGNGGVGKKWVGLRVSDVPEALGKCNLMQTLRLHDDFIVECSAQT